MSPPADHDPLDAEPRSSFWRTLAGVGGLTAAAAIVALAMYAWGLATRLRAIEADLADARQHVEFLAAAETEFVLLTGTAEAPRARAKLAYDRHTGRALFFGYDVPAVPEGKVYQFWLIQGGKSFPGRVFLPEPNGNAQWSDVGPASGREATGFVVTLEPASGAAAPSGPTILKSAARG